MITRTNFQMLKEFDKEFNPEARGILSGDEVDRVNKALLIDERTLIDLRNLRDFVVMFYHISDEEWEKDHKKCMDRSDKCSGIVAVIDHRIFNMGGEV